jgi:hypothetical protein
MSKTPDLSAFPIPRKGTARPIGDDEPAPPPPRPPAGPAPARSEPVRGAVIATTVKLDEGRYLRLAQAGAPRPGRLRRRTIQDIMVEALDEWLLRHDL